MTSISKNVYIAKLDDMVNKYNNTYHNTINDVKSSTYIDSSQEFNDKDLTFKVGDIAEISKYKNILQKAMFQISLKTFLLLKKLKTLCHGHTLLVILKTKKLLERFTKKNYKK